MEQILPSVFTGYIKAFKCQVLSTRQTLEGPISPWFGKEAKVFKCQKGRWIFWSPRFDKLDKDPLIWHRSIFDTYQTWKNWLSSFFGNSWNREVFIQWFSLPDTSTRNVVFIPPDFYFGKFKIYYFQKRPKLMKGQLRGYLQKNAIVNFGFYENWPLSRLDISDLALHFTSAESF